MIVRFDNWIQGLADNAVLLAWNHLGWPKAKVFRMICVGFVLAVGAGIVLRGLHASSAVWMFLFLTITAVHEVRHATLPARIQNVMSLDARSSVFWRLLRLINFVFLPINVFHIAVLGDLGSWQNAAHTIMAMLWGYFLYALTPEAPRKKREPKTVLTPAYAKAQAR